MAWINLISKFGPSALTMLMLVVALRGGRSICKDTGIHAAARYGVFISLWLGFLIFASLSWYAWKEVTLRPENAIRGEIAHFPYNAKLSAAEAEEEIYYYHLPRSPICKWRVVTGRRLRPGTNVDFLIDAGSPTHENVISYRLPIRQEYYDADFEVALRFDATLQKLWVASASGEQELSAIPPDDAPQISEGWTLTRTVRAQSTVAADMTQRLQADDPGIRLAARAELASEGSAALSYIDAVLNDTTASYRLRLGVIVALGHLPPGVVHGLSATAWCSVFRASSEPDRALRDAGSRALKARPATSTSSACPELSGAKRRREDVQPLAGSSTSEAVILISRTPQGKEILLRMRDVQSAAKPTQIGEIAPWYDAIDLVSATFQSKESYFVLSKRGTLPYVVHYSEDGVETESKLLSITGNFASIALDSSTRTLYFSANGSPSNLYAMSIDEGKLHAITSVGGSDSVLGPTLWSSKLASLFVADTRNGDIYRLRPLAQPAGQRTRFQSTRIARDIRNINCFAIDERDNKLYVAGGSTVHRVDLDGQTESTVFLQHLHDIRAAVVDSTGKLWIGDSRGIHVYDGRGTVISDLKTVTVNG